MRSSSLSGLVLLGLIAATASAAEIWTDIGGTIAKFDSTNPGVVTYIGTTGELPMDGMDFTPDGTLYGVADQELFIINQTSGAVQSLGVSQLGSGEIYMDISWDPLTQTMYGVTSSSPTHLYQINLSNAAATLMGVVNVPAPGWSGGLATTAAGVRYIDHSEQDGMYRLDGLNGTFLGPEGLDYSFFGGMTIDWSRDGTLYHATWNQTALRTELWTVDLTTGAGTLLGAIGQQTLLLSAAIQPVPEPGGLAAVALLAACLRRRRGLFRRHQPVRRTTDRVVTRPAWRGGF
jgi:hypothetical protein